MGGLGTANLDLHALTVRQIDAEETLIAFGHIEASRAARIRWKYAPMDQLTAIVEENERAATQAKLRPRHYKIGPPLTAWASPSGFPLSREEERSRMAVD